MAQQQGVDLVEVAPQAKPPVCKLLDYGKFKFEQEKNARDARKKQKLLKLKEVRMQPKIEKHDLAFKTKHIQDFLTEGSKVKVTIRSAVGNLHIRSWAKWCWNASLICSKYRW